MSRWLIIAMLCLCVLAPVQAQDTDDDIPELNYLSLDNIEPIARFGWGTPYNIEFFSDNERIAISTGAGITIYDHTLNEQIHIPTNEHAPLRIAISPDGRLIASGGEDTRLWDVETGALLEIMNTGHGIGGIAFNADGSRIAVSKSWSGGGGIYIFETASGRQQAHLIPDRIFQQVAFHPDGEHLIAQQVYDCCGTVVAIDIQNNTIVSPDIGEAGNFSLSPDGDELITYLNYAGLSAFDLTTPETLTQQRSGETPQADEFLTALSLSDDSISTLTQAGEFIRWDRTTLAPVETLTLGFRHRIAEISPDGRWIVAVDSEESQLHLMDTTQDSRMVRTFLNIQAEQPIVMMGDYVFFFIGDQHLGYWNIWTDEFGIQDTGHTFARALITGSDGWIYTAGSEGRILR